jgi:hypothetical protein
LLAQTALAVVDVALTNSKYRPLVGATLGLGVQYGAILPYSREHEYEADHIGLFYMAKAGYEPSEAIRFREQMERADEHTSWDFFSTHPSHENRRARLQNWLPEAMIYFADQSRPLPSTLAEVQAAIRSRAEQTVSAPEGLKPNLLPGFWVRVKDSNSSIPRTSTVTGTATCMVGECVVMESDSGTTSLVTRDYEMVEIRSANSWVRFDPPLRIQWPLKVGTAWSHMTTIATSEGAKIATRVTGNVVSYESVTVPAGTFMAFRMILSLNGRRFLEAWWAPETRTSVRSIIADPRQGEVVSELIDYQRGDDPAGAF